MHCNFCRIACCLSAALLFAFTAGAHAGIVSYNGSVNGTKSPGGELIFGGGNQNQGFTVSQRADLGLELALRAKTRFPSANDNQSTSPAPGLMNQGNVNNNGVGVYGSFEAQGYGAGNTRASWSFDFSINDSYLANTGGLSPGFTYILLIDYDPSFGTDFLSINALTGRPDNEYGRNTTYGGKADPNVVGSNAALMAAWNVAQNSQQLNFFSGPQLFNPFATGVYDIVLQAWDGAPDVGTLLDQTQIQVHVGATPEPATLTLWGCGALGCAVAGYRRKRKAA